MSNSEFPRDLQSEILSRVPKTSLAKWQTTCKRWCSLLKALLVERNLAKAAREVILLLNSSVFSTNLHGIQNSVDPSMEFRGTLTNLKDSKDGLEISEMFYCNGLILCTMEGNKKLVVSNPCNGETRWIEPRIHYKSDDMYALGYVGSKSSSSSYKILRYFRDYSFKLNRMVSEVEVYEFSSNSWRVLDVEKHNWDISARGVSVNGMTYWIAKYDHDDLGQFILSFDFARERFGVISLPYEVDGPEDILTDDHDDTGVLAAVRDEQLAVLHQYLHRLSLEMKIWVTTDKIDECKEVSWREFLVVDLGEIMLGKLVTVVSFLLDEENEVAVCCSIDVGDEEERITSISIVGQETHQEVYEEVITEGSWPHLLDYVPSEVHIQTKNTPKDKTNRKTKRQEPEAISVRSEEEVKPRRRPRTVAKRSFIR